MIMNAYLYASISRWVFYPEAPFPNGPPRVEAKWYPEGSLIREYTSFLMNDRLVRQAQRCREPNACKLVTFSRLCLYLLTPRQFATCGTATDHAQGSELWASVQLIGGVVLQRCWYSGASSGQTNWASRLSWKLHFLAVMSTDSSGSSMSSTAS